MLPNTETTNTVAATKGWRRLANSSLANAIAAPHGMSQYLEAITPMLSTTQLRARVIGIEQETARATTVELHCNGLWQGFRAGQYIQVGIPVNGRKQQRCYSISSAESARRTITITVQAIDGGTVSQHIQHQANIGDVWDLAPAQGDFVLPQPTADMLAKQDALLFIAGGSGITPIMSMLRSLLPFTGPAYQGPITLVVYARSPAEWIFAGELLATKMRHPNFRLLRGFSQTAERGELTGHFSADHLDADAAKAFASGNAWVCGPEALLNDTQAYCDELGGSMHAERFGFAKPKQSSNPNGDIVFTSSERYVSNNGETLLEQAEQAGVNPSSGCRMGICHSCSCQKQSGKTRDLLTGAVSDGPESIRLCISEAIGDVTLEL